jgi:hypothetical protein
VIDDAAGRSAVGPQPARDCCCSIATKT